MVSMVPMKNPIGRPIQSVGYIILLSRKHHAEACPRCQYQTRTLRFESLARRRADARRLSQAPTSRWTR